MTSDFVSGRRAESISSSGTPAFLSRRHELLNSNADSVTLGGLQGWPSGVRSLNSMSRRSYERLHRSTRAAQKSAGLPASGLAEFRFGDLAHRSAAPQSVMPSTAVGLCGRNRPATNSSPKRSSFGRVSHCKLLHHPQKTTTPTPGFPLKYDNML
jgi:hypothetical protein